MAGHPHRPQDLVHRHRLKLDSPVIPFDWCNAFIRNAGRVHARVVVRGGHSRRTLAHGGGLGQEPLQHPILELRHVAHAAFGLQHQVKAFGHAGVQLHGAVGQGLEA